MSQNSTSDFQALNDEIASLAKAGLPLDQGLEALSRDLGRGRLAKVTHNISQSLKAGKTLPEALDIESNSLPPFYAALVASGIRSGRMAEVLATLTLHARTLAELRSTLWLAMLYPLMVIVAALGLVLFLVSTLVPRFGTIFKDFGMSLPWLTQMLISLGDHPVRNILLPSGIVFGLLLVIWLGLRSSAKGRHFLASAMYTIPGVGTLIRSVRLASFADLMGILVEHHIPLPEAIRMAGEASSDPLLRDASRNLEERLSKGESLGVAMRAEKGVPEMLSWMAGWAEKRGNLANSFRQAAEFYQRRAETRALFLKSILPTVGILTTGLLVGAIVIGGLFAPLINLLEALSK